MDEGQPDMEPAALLLSSLPSRLTVSSAEERALLMAAGDFSEPHQSFLPKTKGFIEHHDIVYYKKILL